MQHPSSVEIVPYQHASAGPQQLQLNLKWPEGIHAESGPIPSKEVGRQVVIFLQNPAALISYGPLSQEESEWFRIDAQMANDLRTQISISAVSDEANKTWNYTSFFERLARQVRAQLPRPVAASQPTAVF